MTKLLYLDTETTGLYANKHGLTQVAAIIVIDGEEKDRINLKINTNTYPRPIKFEEKALEINGETIESIASYANSDDQLRKFVDLLDFYLGTDDTYQVVGYNVSFDIGFIKAWFKDWDYKYSEFFSYKDIDVLALVRNLQLSGVIDTENAKLGTLCDYFDIPLDAHDAMNDIEATRTLYQLLVNEYITMGAKI